MWTDLATYVRTYIHTHVHVQECLSPTRDIPHLCTYVNRIYVHIYIKQFLYRLYIRAYVCTYTVISAGLAAIHCITHIVV